MRVYHFINKKYGLEALRNERLKISGIMDLNDPFEFLSVNLSDKSMREAVAGLKRHLAKSKGILCFSEDWRNPVLWAHYAEKHKGLCLGFDVPYKNLMKMNYEEKRVASPKNNDALNLDFVNKLLKTKFAHWEYEQEYRLFVVLKTKTDGFYFSDFSSELDLKQIIVGAKSDISRDDISKALGDDESNIETFKTRAAFKSFRIERQQNEKRWT